MAVEKKRQLLKRGVSLFGDSYPKAYLETLRHFFASLEGRGWVKRKNPPGRIRRFKTT